MATNTIVSMLLEGVMTTGSLECITENEARTYTLESGANIMARECVQELHEIFETAVVAANEAALAAYMEGTTDVMESATYGPVFEQAEKSAGQKIVDFFKKLKDRVIAFFQNIGAKIVLAVNNYDKFYEKHKTALKGANAIKIEVLDWSDDRIDKLASTIIASADTLKSFATDAIEELNKALDAKNKPEVTATKLKKLDAAYQKSFNEVVSRCGIDKSKKAEELELVEINKIMRGVFVKPKKVEKTVGHAYIESVMKGTKKAAADIKSAQAKFNDAYKSTISMVEKAIAEMKKSGNKGNTAHLSKISSYINKMQTVINAYTSNGYRAVIGRASEAKSITLKIVSGEAEENMKTNKPKNGGYIHE